MSRILGTSCGVLGIVIGSLPVLSAITTSAHLCWVALTASPNGGTLRPMAFLLQIAMTTVVGLLICMPIAVTCGYYASRLGCRTVGTASKIVGCTFAAPLLIGIIGFLAFAIIADSRGVPTD